MNKNDVVMFKTPMADEDPRARYLLKDEPDEVRRHAEDLNKKYPNCPVKPRVQVEYLGKVGDDGRIVRTSMAFAHVSAVLLEDLETDRSFFGTDPELDKRYSGKKVLIKVDDGAAGVYLTKSGRFDGRRKQALLHDYDRDDVGGQVYQLTKMGMDVVVELP